MQIEVLNSQQWLSALSTARIATPGGVYKAMYSTWWNGVVTDPALMLLPLDEHMVHRGDGIFEAARVVNGALFDLEAHLQRLARSAQQIFLPLPMTLEQIASVCVATVKASHLSEAALRLFVGRGPGSFSPNPYDSSRSHLYVVVTDFKPLSESQYSKGVSAMVSRVPQKDPFYARIKSCNYLPNVLMKKESVDAGVDFSLGCREDGVLYEGATENMALLDQKQILRIPSFDYTLCGTTLMAVVDSLRKEPLPQMIRGIEFGDLKLTDLLQAQEAFMIGTTLEVLPLVQVEKKSIGAGCPGPVALELRKRLKLLMTKDPTRRTEIV